MRAMRWVLLVTAAVLVSLGPAQAQPRTVNTAEGPIAVETIAGDLEHPWGLSFLPDGRMLVTERPGRLRIVTRQGDVSQPVAGTPRVFGQGQGGLLDVALPPDFASSRMVYLSFAEPGEGGASTAVARGRLADAGLEDLTVIFRQEPKVSGGNHFGSRLVFAPDGTLFVTLGERFKFDPAQDLANHLGTIVRINPDGSVPQDNPFRGRENVRPEIWSYGHRNIQGAALNSESGALWIHEMGPRGGDEINVPEPGRNYGWPLVSKGRHYDGRDIPDPSSRPDLAGAVYYWDATVAPSGMAFYTGSAIPAWRGSLLVGGLAAKALVRVSLSGSQVTGDERIPMDARIRDVRQGPDGAVYLLTDEGDGKLLRLSAADR